jgi:small-conductance mechanosensitive channel
MAGVDLGLWFRLALVLLHIGFCSGLFLAYRRRPFISDWINSGGLAVCFYDVRLGASGLIAHITMKMTGFPIFVSTFVLLPVSGVAVFFVSRFEMKAEVWKEVTRLLQCEKLG